MELNRIGINHGWLFKKDDAPQAVMPGYDESGFQPVTLPHDWQIQNPQSPEAPGGGSQGFFTREEVGVYRYHFIVDGISVQDPKSPQAGETSALVTVGDGLTVAFPPFFSPFDAGSFSVSCSSMIPSLSSTYPSLGSGVGMGVTTGVISGTAGVPITISSRSWL